MQTKEIYEILNSIITNDVQTPDGVKSELMFSDGTRNYNADEMAELINQIDVEQLGSDEVEMIEILHRRLSNDNSNGNLFTNEEALVGPLSQKITEYNHVVEDQEFQSNMTTLETLKARNQRMSNVNAIHLSEKESDSHYNLDYVSVRVNGKVEMLPISDPDYMERFVTEHANDIADMTEDQFYNTLKNSTQSELEFIPIDKYLTDPQAKVKFTNPKIDDHMLTFEMDEVKRLVEQFIPGTDIEIGVDRDGEVFYRAGDAILKGKDKDGHRSVEFVQKPGKIQNYVDNKAIDQNNIEQVKKEAEELGIDDAQGMEGRVGVKKEVSFDEHYFRDALPNWKDTLTNGNVEEKEDFLSQLDALAHEVEHAREDELPPLMSMLSSYIFDRIEDYHEMQKRGRSISPVPMSAREYQIFEELEKDGILRKVIMGGFREDRRETKEAADKAVEEARYEREQREKREAEEDYFGFDDEYGTNTNSQYDLGDVRAEEVGYDNNQEVQQNYDIESFADAPVAVQDAETYNQEYEAGMTMSAPTHPGLTYQPRVRTLNKNKKNNSHYGMTALVLLLEMLTVAMIIMMFLSLDI